MLDSVRYGHKQILHVKIILFEMQKFTCIAQICLKHTENSSRKWTICGCPVCNSVIVDVHGHRFKLFTLVSEIHENVDLVLGIKNQNIFKLESMTDIYDSCFSFLNRSIPFFPKEKTEIKSKEQKLVIIEAPFVEEI